MTGHYYVFGTDVRTFKNMNPEEGDELRWYGKTSELSIKIDPDKSIDLDDGTTEVGSAKLRFSVELLEELSSIYLSRYIHLVPADNVNGDTLSIDLGINAYQRSKMSEDIKTGEFGKTEISLEANIPVEMLTTVFFVQKEILFGYAILMVELEGFQEIVGDNWSYDILSMNTMGKVACILPMGNDTEITIFTDTGSYDYNIDVYPGIYHIGPDPHKQARKIL